MLELEHGFRVVDVNVRLDSNAEDVATRGRDITPERLEREMHQAGVVRTVVAPGPRAPGEGYLRANNAVARLSVDRPFLAFARLNGPRDPGETPISALRNLAATRRDHHAEPGDVEQYAYDDRFHGFLLAPAVDGLPQDDVLEQIEAAGAPMLVHGGPEFPPRAVAATLLEWDVPVILASFGGHRLPREQLAEALDLLDDHGQLYLDTSFVRFRSLLERGLLEHPDRICFGSGAPAAHPNVGVMELLTLDVSEDAMTRAFSKNPARVIPALAPGEQ
ncbi:MAG: amidohydrolase family protein [Haloferacaceae archaeon]